MLTPALEQLLVLQDRDLRRLGLESQLRAVPGDIAAVEKRIATERAAIDTAKGEIRECESRKKLLETEIGSLEQRLGQYRTQQLGVRKNDEFQALGHQIETVQNEIGDLEGKELEAMYAIDEARKRFAAAEATLRENIQGHENRIRVLRERETSLTAELAAARSSVAEARGPLDEIARSVYDRAAGRGTPMVVAIRGGKCGGCHLKVSSDVESAARGKAPAGEFALCDQCGRLVYWES